MSHSSVWQVRARLFSTSLLLAVVVSACGEDEATSMVCGPGTQIIGDECLPLLPNQVVDAGTADAAMQDLPIVDSATLTCGAGTIMMNGQCVATPVQTLTCGAGTVAQDGVCIVAPPAAPAIHGLTISHLSVRSQGTVLGDGDKINQHYPVEVSIGVTYSGDPTNIPLVFGLGEVPKDAATGAANLGVCLVGGVEVHHPGGATPTEAFGTGTMYIPEDCLKHTEQSRRVGPLVVIDPDNAVVPEGQGEIGRSVAFLKIHEDDPEVLGCRRDTTPSGQRASCDVELEVVKSPGLDFELSELHLESAVAVLDRCAADWESIADGSAQVDVDRPVPYRCNSSIVPELKRDQAGEIVKDGDGHPVQATYTNRLGQTVPKWVFGASEIALDLTVVAHGEEHSDADSLDHVTASGGDDQMLVNDVLERHDLKFVYSIKPARAEGAEWKPLYLHEQGEPAEVGGAEGGQKQEVFEESDLAAATPHYYTKSAYIEDDCGEHNPETCNRALNTRTDIIYGAWSSETDFLVRACVVAVDANGNEDRTVDVDHGNNCKEVPIKVVRHDTSGAAADASSYGFNYQFKDGVGSKSTLRLGWNLHTWNGVNTQGVTVDNEAEVVLASNLIGSQDIMSGWAKGAAYVSLVGSYYDYGLTAFGVKVWGDAKEVPEYHWEKDWNVSKQMRASTVLWAGPVPVTVQIRFAGQAGLVANLDIIAVDAPFAPNEEAGMYLAERAVGASRVGLATLRVKPYGEMDVHASASIDAAAARVGVAGELTLIDLRTPLEGRLWWGMTSVSPVKLKAGAWADMKLHFSTMDGRIYVYAQHWDIKWCKKKIVFKKISYPCGEEWETFWDYTIADWNGWRWNQTMWASPYAELAIQ